MDWLSGLRRSLELFKPIHQARHHKPRKVLFVYRYCGLGGVETATLAKMEALKRVGIDASVLFSQFYGDGGRGFANYPGVTIGIPDPKKLVTYLQQGFAAIFIIDYPDFLDLLDRNGIEVPVFLETHSSIPASFDRLYRHLADPRVRAIIVPAQHNERTIRQRLHLYCDVVIIPNAVDEQKFLPGRAASQLPLPWTPCAEKLVLWVGRLEDEKNPCELIAIAEHVLQRTNGIRFLVVGDIPERYEQSKAELVNRIGNSKRPALSFIRAVPYASMPDLYRMVAGSGGLLLSTSMYESLPMVFLEAMACGCPVLSTDVGGVREVIKDESTGRLYPLGDVNRAAEIVLDLLAFNKRGSVLRMTRRARKNIVRRHSLSVVASRYCKLLNGNRSLCRL